MIKTTTIKNSKIKNAETKKLRIYYYNKYAFMNY